MNVLVNGTTLKAKTYAERDTVTGIITCTIIVPQSEMDYADLKALFKGNTEDIVYTKDDGSTELFSGFTYSHIVDDDANGQYIIKLTADEYSFQLGRNRQLEADKASLEGTVASKDMEISNLNTAVAEKDKTIAEREETITAKDTVIGEKEVVITEQKETITILEATVAEKETEITAKDAEIAELLTIAEEYADMLYNEALEEIEAETAVDGIELPEAENKNVDSLEREVL